MVPKAQASYRKFILTVYIIHKIYINIYKESILYTQMKAVLIFNVIFVKGQLLYFCVLFVCFLKKQSLILASVIL